MVIGEVGPSPHFLLEARADACSLLGAQSTPDTDQDPCTLFPPCWQTPSSCKHTPQWLWAPILTLFVFNLLCLLFELDSRCKILWGLQFWNHQTVSNGSYILPATQLPAADPALLCRGSITWHSHVFPHPTPRHSCPQSTHAPSSPKQPWHCHGAHPAQHRASFSILLRAGERFNTYLSDAGSGRCLWGCVGETGLKREGNKSHIAAGLLVHGEVLGLWIDQAGLLAGTWSCSNVMRRGMQGLGRLALMLLSCPCAGWMAAGQTQQSQTEGSLCNGTAPALPQGQKMMVKTGWWMWTCPILPAFPGGKHTEGGFAITERVQDSSQT